MRWIVVAVLAMWGLYLASPYWSLFRLAGAVERGDVGEVRERVNLRALRLSIARQIAGEIAGAVPGVSTSDAQIAASSALVLADPMIEGLLTPAGLAKLLHEGPTGGADGAPFGGEPVSWVDLDDFLAASTWRGFRNVYVSLPPDEPPATRFRLQMRFGQLKWRLIAVDLPAETRRRLAEQIRRRAKS